MTRFCSIFNQLLHLFSRTEFAQAVAETGAERRTQVSCWQQFVAMLFCQLAGAHSLREICGGLASCEQRLTHLGIEAPKRSTLSYANAHRPWELYQRVYYQLFARVQAIAPGKRLRFKNKLLSLDATVVDLCAEVFPWAAFRRRKGAVKLHFTLDHDGCLPTALVITEGKRQETPVARTQHYDPGTILVFDMGYLDFAWFASLTAEGVWFVTRMKDNTDYRVVERYPVPAHGHVTADDRIVLCGPLSRHKYPGVLRHVRVIVPETDEPLDFLTNHLQFGPTTIARIYKDRWQIELFFKTLKQHLRVKTFVGTSANALHTQIWTALIALLLLKYLQFKAQLGWSLSNLAALLRMNLLVYRDLWGWLDHPSTPPDSPPGPVQEGLPLRPAWTASGEMS